MSGGYKNLKAGSYCLDPETLVLTKEGIYPIKSLVGKEVELWDGKNWVKNSQFRKTQNDAQLWKVTLQDGSEILATSNHRFPLEGGEIVELSELQKGDLLEKYSITYSGDGKEAGAYFKGFALGDGYLGDKGRQNKYPRLHIYDPKLCCVNRLIESANEVPINYYEEAYDSRTIQEVGFTECQNFQGLTARQQLNPWFSVYKESLPNFVYNWSIETKLNFLAGVFDSDGTAVDHKNGFSYQLSSTHKQFLLDIQNLLKTIGVYSRVCIMVSRSKQTWASGVESNAKDLYCLKIHQVNAVKFSSLVKFERLNSFSNKQIKCMRFPKYNAVVSVQPLNVTSDVYCTTVETTSKFALGNGLMTGNCNLVSIPVPDYISEKGEVLWNELEEALRVVTRFAVRQTLIDISLPLWDVTQKKERLLGVDLCGTWEAFDKMGVSVTSDESNQLRSFCKQIANDEATNYSQELGIERPLLVTTGKPNGTYAQLRTIASGCHPPYAPFYIRRIRIAATDALAKTLIEQKIPYYPETSEWESYFRTNLSHLIKKDAEGNETTTVWDMLKIYDDFGKPVLPEIKTLVFEFPVKTAATRKTSEISAIEQLENYKMQMVHYIDHNQSVTITVGDNEWDEVAEWFEENWDYVIGVSLLPKFADDVYPLLPYQECTEEEFNQRVAAFPEYPLNVNMDLLNKFELEIEETQDVDDVDTSMMGECSAGGSCPVR